jgi:hypothetical protein
MIMDIRSQLQDQIDRGLSQSNSGAPRVLAVDWPEGQLRIELHELQPLGCALWQLDVRTVQTSTASADQLRAGGHALATRVRYLLEPLQVHEVDAEQSAVQLRSTPPDRQDRTVGYYEVTAQRDGGWRLVRYEKSPGQPRRHVTALVTLEVLRRLCQDVVDIASTTGGRPAA